MPQSIGDHRFASVIGVDGRGITHLERWWQAVGAKGEQVFEILSGMERD